MRRPEQVGKEYFSLVDPEQSFDWFNTRLTGICEESIAGAPTFPQLWKQIEPLMSSGILVAHNASFDMCVLRYMQAGAQQERFVRAYTME